MSLPVRLERLDRESASLHQPRELAPEEVRPRPEAPTHAYAALVFLVGCCIAGAFCSYAWRGNPASSALALYQSPPSANAAVQLLSAVVDRRLGYVTVTGSISNRVSRPVRSAEAVVELLDASGRIIATESAVIGLDPLAPGDTAPFQVEMPDQPAAVGYRVRFRRLGGAAID